MFKNKVVWIIIAIVAILFFWVKGVYNNMVTQDAVSYTHLTLPTILRV